MLIKICNAGHLNILGLLFEEVIIPGKVYEEVLRKLQNHQGHLSEAIDKQLIRLINISQLEPSQRRGIESFFMSYRDSMDDESCMQLLCYNKNRLLTGQRKRLIARMEAMPATPALS